MLLNDQSNIEKLEMTLSMIGWKMKAGSDIVDSSSHFPMISAQLWWAAAKRHTRKALISGGLPGLSSLNSDGSCGSAGRLDQVSGG